MEQGRYSDGKDPGEIGSWIANHAQEATFSMESNESSKPNKTSDHEPDEEKTSIDIIFVGFPMIYDLFKKNHIHHSFSGRSLKDLIEDLLIQYGQQMKESLWDERSNGLDPCIQITINGRYVGGAELRSIEISQGDHVTFLRLIAGG